MANLRDDDTRHGTIGAYTNHGCRCAACRQTWTTYITTARTARIARGPLPDDDPRHGSVNTYNNYNCRCPECRKAKSDYRLAVKRGGA